ncbi:MAG TPA: SDR family oxidoreductase [Ktedonobacteraceae bacterium]|nr:SDR family oxidoreductase [Ktedonobacteraceae bacterium]
MLTTCAARPKAAPGASEMPAVNSISPGIILNSLAQQGMASEGGPVYRAMIETSAARRVGTTDAISSAAAYPLGPDAAFITGSDLLIDGGVIAALRTGRLHLPG